MNLLVRTQPYLRLRGVRLTQSPLHSSFSRLSLLKSLSLYSFIRLTPHINELQIDTEIFPFEQLNDVL